MSAAESAEKGLIVSREAVADDLGRAVRLFCIIERQMTIGTLATAAGIGEGRLRDLIDNDPAARRPAHLAEALALWAVMGTRSASLCLARIGMVAEPEEAEPDNITRAAAGLAMASGQLAMIAADGAVQLDEADAADKAADEAITAAVALKAAARKAKRRGKR